MSFTTILDTFHDIIIKKNLMHRMQPIPMHKILVSIHVLLPEVVDGHMISLQQSLS